MPPQPSIGEWQIVKADPINQTGCALDAEQEAVHMCVIYNPDNDYWKIFYFTALSDPNPPPSGAANSRIWDKNSPVVPPPILTQASAEILPGFNLSI